MSTQNALEQIIEQVPTVDQYGLDLLKKKVDFLKELTPKWIDPTPVGSTSETPVYDASIQGYGNVVTTEATDN